MEMELRLESQRYGCWVERFFTQDYSDNPNRVEDPSPQSNLTSLGWWRPLQKNICVRAAIIIVQICIVQMTYIIQSYENQMNYVPSNYVPSMVQSSLYPQYRFFDCLKLRTLCNHFNSTIISNHPMMRYLEIQVFYEWESTRVIFCCLGIPKYIL